MKCVQSKLITINYTNIVKNKNNQSTVFHLNNNNGTYKINIFN